MVVAKESDVTERMIHTGGEQIQGNETCTQLKRQGAENRRKGGGGAVQAGQYRLSSLRQGPTMSPGGQGSAVL